jgi:hypothetical protein
MTTPKAPPRAPRRAVPPASNKTEAATIATAAPSDETAITATADKPAAAKPAAAKPAAAKPAAAKPAAAKPAAAKPAAAKPAAAKPAAAKPAAAKPAAAKPAAAKPAAAKPAAAKTAAAKPAVARPAPAPAPEYPLAVPELAKVRMLSHGADDGKKARPQKIVRDSYSIPEDERAGIKTLRVTLKHAGRRTSKSELLRAGLALLWQLDAAELLALVNALPPAPGKKRKKG